MSAPVSSAVIKSLIFMALSCALPLQAYPGAPGTWSDWQTKTIAGVVPRQLAAATDPDGRLRLAYINAIQSHTNPSTGRVSYGVEWLSFTRFASGLPADRVLRGACAGAFPFTFGGSRDPGTSMLTAPGRVNLVIGLNDRGFQADYGWLSQTGSDADAVTTQSAVLRWFPRVENSQGGPYIVGFESLLNWPERQAVAKNQRFSGAVIAGPANTGLSVKIDINNTNFSNDATPSQWASVFLPDPVVDWSTGRTCDGLYAAFNEPVTLAGPPGREECDLYLMLATRKFAAGLTTREIRLFRQRLTYTVANPADMVITTVQNKVIATASTSGSDFPGSGGYRYPKILVTASRSPLWLVWEDATAGEVRVATRGGFPTPVNELADVYVLPAGLSGALTAGKEPDASLDRLNRLHVVWRETGTPDFCHYARQTAAGGFEEIPIGVCSGAPAVSVGPGEYPWIAYPGDADSGGTLTIRYPRGLYDSYHGDWEDRDADGQPALLEKAAGTSDNTPTFPVEHIGLTILNEGPFTRRPQLSYRLAAATVQDGTTTRFTMADGNDTIEIRPAYTTDFQTWTSTSGFTLVSTFGLAGRRIVVVNDNGILLNFPAQSYRLQVRRIVGEP
jgi:hypothetical protein